jgi:N-acetylglucosaminyldiphosphoundecaprenol N-acetyl-beta-D-mannosaminyltransferase
MSREALPNAGQHPPRPTAGSCPSSQPAAERARFAIGQLRLQPLSLAETTRWVVDRALAEQPALVVTSNIYHLMLAELHPDFAELVRGCDLNVADGWPLVLASRMLRPRVPERVAGIDLVAHVLDEAPRLRVAVLGGYADAADRFAERFSGRHDIVVVDALTPGGWDTPEYRGGLLERLRAARPNMVLVGVGAPRQELLAAELRPYVAGPLICCGATIEVLGDVRPRAPGLMRHTGLEWAFRLALEPKRLGPRYFRAGGWFLRLTAREGRHRLADKLHPPKNLASR